jgi:undecaprenyl-diphosphatase
LAFGKLVGSAVPHRASVVSMTPPLAEAPVPGNVPVLPPRGLNRSAYLDINHFARQTGWAHSFMHAYALWLGLVLLTVVFVAAYVVTWWRRDHHAAALLVLGAIGTVVAFGVNQLVGHAAGELRPYDTLHGALVLVPKANDYAFPSDHAVAAGALITAVLLVCWRPARRRLDEPGAGAASRAGEPTERAGFVPAMVALDIVEVVIGLFLCFARIYVGAHYPGDVVAGLLLGAVVVMVVVVVARPLAYWLTDLVAPTPLAVLASRPPQWGHLTPPAPGRVGGENPSDQVP